MHDTPLLLLMHEANGLKLEPAELANVIRAGELPADELLRFVRSKGARDYISAHPHWARESVEILKESADHGIQWSRLGSIDYPREWLSLSEKPYAFNYQGQPYWRECPMLAVVGSRTPMMETRMWMQRELPIFLRKNAVGIVSGGARGIDQCAHRIALDSGRPTVCILPSGLRNRYPPASETFWRQVLSANGCLLSTLAPSKGMEKAAFHIRNRWIAGLAPLVFVAEANRRSGSSITAEKARDEDRELCTLPVFPHSEQGLGNLDIIQSGGTMLRDWMDLQMAWDRVSCPGLFEAANRKSKEQGVHQPQGDGGVQPTVAGDTFGGKIENPVRH